MKTDAKILLGLLLFNGASGLAGGIGLMTGMIPTRMSWIEHTDFNSFFFPGVVLMAVVGGSSLVAALAMIKSATGWRLASVLAGAIMLLWVIGEIAAIRDLNFLQGVYFVTGALVIRYTPKESAPSGE